MPLRENPYREETAYWDIFDLLLEKFDGRCTFDELLTASRRRLRDKSLDRIEYAVRDILSPTPVSHEQRSALKDQILSQYGEFDARGSYNAKGHIYYLQRLHKPEGMVYKLTFRRSAVDPKKRDRRKLEVPQEKVSRRKVGRPRSIAVVA